MLPLLAVVVISHQVEARMKKRTKSRQEWEQEMWERQLNLTYDQSLRAVRHIAADGSSETFSTGQLVGAILGSVSLALGLVVLSQDIRYASIIGSLAVAFGLCLIVGAFRSKRAHKDHREVDPK